MHSQSLHHSIHFPIQTQKPRFLSQSLLHFRKTPALSLPISNFSISFSPLSSGILRSGSSRLVTHCVSPSEELIDDTDLASESDCLFVEEEKEENISKHKQGLENQSLWQQIKEIVMFTAPATGMWISGPLMSLIDTAVIGQGSSLELAALDRNELQHQLSVLLFIGLTCGFLMILFTKFFGISVLTAFTGSKNLHIVPVANTYVQIRGLAWPAILIGWVAQSASLGMKDPWGPLKALAVASAVNGIGDIILCRFLDYGIAGAAWATMVSQVIAAYMMIKSLNEKGYNACSISIPSPSDLMTIFGLAAPIFVVMMSKVAFYSLLVYCATSLGTLPLAAHQVMIQAFMTCSVWGEPLSQTAQSFMPELMYGSNRSLERARMLLKSLVIIGTILGLFLGIVGTSVPGLFPNIFTPDPKVIQEMHKVLLPFFMALAVTPCILSFEGTLLAGRDLKFLSLSMSGCFSVGTLALLIVSSRGYGLLGCWCTLLGFQWARLFLALQRLLSPNGILFSENLSQPELLKLKAA